MLSPVAELFHDLAAVLEPLGVGWYLFGAQAALLHGAARLTADVDVTVDLGGREPVVLCEALARGGFDVRVGDVAAFIGRTGVIPLAHRASGFPLDVVIAGPGLEQRFLARARVRVIEGVSVPVASVEDMVAMKILAGRPKDVDDALAILTANPDVDGTLAGETLRLLESALDRSDLVPALTELLRRARQPP